jgi:hypothetical protein
MGAQQHLALAKVCMLRCIHLPWGRGAIIRRVLLFGLFGKQ